MVWPFRQVVGATIVSCLAGVASLVLAPPAWANFAPRFRGEATSEPWGLKDVAIAHERLTIDLRPLADAGPVGVDATYALTNAGPPQHLDLLFISGAVGVNHFEAYLGSQPLPARPLPEDESRRLWEKAPPSWRPPLEAPGIEFEKTYLIFYNMPPQWALVALSLDLPSGPSTLNVRYQARACGAIERPTVTWQFPYMLAPAREWGGFGRLEVLVHLPGGWDSRSTPALERDGDALRGSFDGLPADALLLATSPPVPREYDWAVRLSVALCVAALMSGPVMCWLAGRRLGRVRATARAGARAALLRRVLGVLSALLWGGLIYASVLLSLAMIKASLHGQESPGYGGHYLIEGCVIYLLPAFVLLGSLITLGAASRAARRHSAKPPG